MRIIPFLVVALMAWLLFGTDRMRSHSPVRQTIAATTDMDTAKIKRLRFEKSIAQLDVNYWHRQLRPYAMSDHPPAAMLDSLGAANVRLDLATRALNRFMYGP